MMNAILGIAGGVIGLLLTVSGFFIARYFNHQDKINDRTFDTFDKLNDSINNLNTTLKVMQEHQTGFEQKCQERHKVLNKQLETIKP
ncbi:hypothetical protein ES705_45649 [subsurface metagenome]